MTHSETRRFLWSLFCRLKRWLMLWAVGHVENGDRLEVVMGILKEMPEEQRKTTISKIVSEYRPGTHFHRNPRRKKEEGNE